ncbi:MAG TPA: sigma-70 family RNA polymerase sigma factor [Polyangiaceae bacterium]|nr:sigma-70 family RNA polymerase sigma factor [Polyangiaceae bacterium]
MPGLSRADIEDAYRQYAHSVLRRAQRLLGSQSEAHEVLQEVFMALLERPGQFAGQSSLLTWLYSAATHACLNRLRNARSRTELAERHQGALLPPSSWCAPDQALVVRRLLAGLRDELAAVAVYHHLDRMTLDETAEALGCSRRKVAYLLAELREHLSRRETPSDQPVL